MIMQQDFEEGDSVHAGAGSTAESSKVSPQSKLAISLGGYVGWPLRWGWRPSRGEWRNNPPCGADDGAPDGNISDAVDSWQQAP